MTSEQDQRRVRQGGGGPLLQVVGDPLRPLLRQASTSSETYEAVRRRDVKFSHRKRNGHRDVDHVAAHGVVVHQLMSRWTR